MNFRRGFQQGLRIHASVLSAARDRKIAGALKEKKGKGGAANSGNAAVASPAQNIAAGRPRGNSVLPVKGAERARIPDEFDVVYNDMIVGRGATEEERAAILAAAKDE